MSQQTWLNTFSSSKLVSRRVSECFQWFSWKKFSGFFRKSLLHFSIFCSLIMKIIEKINFFTKSFRKNRQWYFSRKSFKTLRNASTHLFQRLNPFWWVCHGIFIFFAQPLNTVVTHVNNIVLWAWKHAWKSWGNTFYSSKLVNRRVSECFKWFSRQNITLDFSRRTWRKNRFLQ